MELNEFVQLFAKVFEETPIEEFKPSTIFKDIDEWDSLIALSVISVIDDELNKEISGADLRNSKTIEDLYKLVMAL
jgi:acyl carrier protein